MKQFFLFVLLCILIGCGRLNTIVNELKNNTVPSQSIQTIKEDLTPIKTKDNYTYYVSTEEINWVNSYHFCESKGKYFANYLRPICPLKTDNMYDVLNNKLNYAGACNNLTGLTAVDTYVWFYPALGGRYGLVVNLKNGAVVLKYIYDTTYQGKPIKALCEDVFISKL